MFDSGPNVELALDFWCAEGVTFIDRSEGLVEAGGIKLFL